MIDRYLALTDREARLAAKGELRAIVRAIPDIPAEYKWVGWVIDTTGNRFHIGHASWYKGGEWPNVTDQIYRRCPFGAPGDVVHLREGYCIDEDGVVDYKADFEPEGFKWRSPVTMPQLFIRYHLRVKRVRAMIARHLTIEDLHYKLGFRSRLREHDACCDLREQAWKAFGITDPSQWIFYAELEDTNG
jgi:hypothetical protein